MKKVTVAFALMLGVTSIILSACSKDDDPKNLPAAPVITLQQVGEEDNGIAVAGTDLHTEGDILAEGKVKAFTIEAFDKDGKSVGKKTFSDPSKDTDKQYVGVKNPHFHEHLDIAGTAAIGDGEAVFTVTDESDQTVSVKRAIHITAKIAEVTNLLVAGGKNTGKVGQPISVTAHIEMLGGAKIDEIEVEFHNEAADAEYPVSYTAYAGKATADFNENYILPADAPAGEYHVHFTITDDKGNSETVGIEGVQITK